ncbi:MAG: hypothetical protein KatS3mg054_1409 [Chloroflexus sp.]|nr:MAG: hypothetical protein KatS3mg054_1409 [Chloroflexus sp.]
MNNEQNQILTAMLQELKRITEELQLLRSELKVQPSPRVEEAIPSISPEQVIESPNEIEKESVLAVHDWLIAKGITVRNYREQSADDKVFDQLAVFLGTKFKNLSSVYEIIKRNLSTGSSFTLNISSKSKEEIASSTKFCSMLNSYAFLSSYNYNKSTKTIHATPQRVGKIIKFFNGEWFERYIYLTILSLLSQSRLKFTCLLNPKITFSSGNDFELDMLFLIDGQPLWVECKTGSYQAYIAKYSDARKLLSVPKSRAILIILDIADDLTASLTNLYDITVANENNFLERVRAAIELSEYAQEQESNVMSTPNSTVASSGVSKLLNKVGLRPVPEYRQQVIVELIAVVKSLDQPTTVAEMKSVLANKMRVSKNQLQNLFNAMIRSGCFLDNDGQTVMSFTSPFSKLVSYNPSVIESKCIESYARAVLLVDPNYFENQHNVSEFEHTVGGNVPNMATIERLRAQPLT